MKQCDHTLKGGFAPQPFSTSVPYNHLILSHRNLPCPDLFPSDGCAIILFIQESNDWFSGILKHEKVGHQNATLPLTSLPPFSSKHSPRCFSAISEYERMFFACKNAIDMRLPFHLRITVAVNSFALFLSSAIMPKQLSCCAIVLRDVNRE